jgi:hypothetical protein
VFGDFWSNNLNLRIRNSSLPRAASSLDGHDVDISFLLNFVPARPLHLLHMQLIPKCAEAASSMNTQVNQVKILWLKEAKVSAVST